MRKINVSLLPIFLLPCLLHAQELKVLDSFSELEERISQSGSTKTLVINFWATWCAPCVEELPCFDELYRNHADDDFQVIMVTLDFKSRIESAVLPFLNKWAPKQEIVLLADQDGDKWIPKVHQDWGGAIPATVVVCGEQRALAEKQFESYVDLESFVLDFVGKVQKTPKVCDKGAR